MYSHLSDRQKQDIIEMILESNGCHLSEDEVSELICCCLDNVAGFETVDSQTLTQCVEDIRKLYYESVEQEN